MSPNFDNSYTRLPDFFHRKGRVTPSPSPKMVATNPELAQRMGISAEWLHSDVALFGFAGTESLDGASPIAMAYGGHQFGGWSPQLGDGRALLLGEVVAKNGVRFDLHLKGSGRTEFSRRGDGKATLGSVLREYLVSEAMFHLGVPTTRSLAALTTGESIRRDSMQPAAILVRVGQSHVRVGTFQYAHAHGETADVKALADYVIDRHFPDARKSNNPYRALLEQAIVRQAQLVAQWMSYGFIHGVMNTDNSLIVGDTIDYGPCAFMDTFHPQKVFSSIDRNGRYAFAQQPAMAQWNLTRFAETLIPLLADDPQDAVKWAEEVLNRFGEHFNKCFIKRFSQKLGLPSQEHEALVQTTLIALTEQQVDFTLFFRHLTLLADGKEHALHALFDSAQACDAWLTQWREVHDTKCIPDMKKANPVFIPRNHRIEEAIAAANGGDFGPFHRLHAVLETPFTESTDHADLEMAPLPQEVVCETFCGT